MIPNFSKSALIVKVAEMREKKDLYFEAGAEEVWFCHRDGRMEFFLRAAPETPTLSVLCPAFPARIETEV